MTGDPKLLIFEMFPGIREKRGYETQRVAASGAFYKLEGSEHPVAKLAVSNLSDLNLIWANDMYPLQVYLIINRNEQTATLPNDLPPIFRSVVVPKKLSLFESLRFIENPSKHLRFLNDCINSIEANFYATEESEKAVKLLKLYGGRREAGILAKEYLGILMRLKKMDSRAPSYFQ